MVSAPALLRQLADQVGATADDAVRELAARWLAEWDTLEPVWRAAVTDIVARYQATGVWPAPWETARIPSVASATARTDRTVPLLLTEAAVTTGAAAAAVSAATAVAHTAIISAALSTAAAGAAAHQVAAALTARRHRITDLHRPVAAETTNSVRYVLTRPGRLPADPARTADTVFGRVRAGFDTGLNRAVTIARTELVDTYRTAAHLVDTANRHLFGEWEWRSQVDSRTCPACWAMHGTRWPITTPGPAGHPNCRCMRLPVPRSGGPVVDAAARFARLPRARQIAVMGPARLALLSSGRIGWDDLAVRRSTNGWRPSYQTRTVSDLQLIADRRPE